MRGLRMLFRSWSSSGQPKICWPPMIGAGSGKTHSSWFHRRCTRDVDTTRPGFRRSVRCSAVIALGIQTIESNLF